MRRAVLPFTAKIDCSITVAEVASARSEFSQLTNPRQNPHHRDHHHARERVQPVDRRPRIFEYVEVANDRVQADADVRYDSSPVRQPSADTENELAMAEPRRKSVQTSKTAKECALGLADTPAQSKTAPYAYEENRKMWCGWRSILGTGNLSN